MPERHPIKEMPKPLNLVLTIVIFLVLLAGATVVIPTPDVDIRDSRSDITCYISSGGGSEGACDRQLVRNTAVLSRRRRMSGANREWCGSGRFNPSRYPIRLRHFQELPELQSYINLRHTPLLKDSAQPWICLGMKKKFSAIFSMYRAPCYSKEEETRNEPSDNIQI